MQRSPTADRDTDRPGQRCVSVRDLPRFPPSPLRHALARNRPILRRFPPVYAKLPLRDLVAAGLALRTPDAGLHDAATAHLARAYPGQRLRLTASGTHALSLAIALSVPAGSRLTVALPAFACPDLGTAAIGAGADIVLYDVNPHTLEPDLDSLMTALAQGCTHVVVAHFFGRLVDLAPLQPLVKTAGAVLIEDAAQHAGATLHGRRGGAHADWGVLSFGRGKGLNAGGGGALLVREAAAQAAGVAERLAAAPLAVPSVSHAMADLLRAAAAEWLAHPLLYRLPSSLPGLQLGETVYHPPVPPAGCSGTQAALLAVALRDEPAALRERQTAEAWYRDMLRDRPALLFEMPPNHASSGALRFPVRLDPAIGRLLAPYGVARSYPRTLDAYPPIRAAMAGEAPPLPGARELAACTHTLPTHHLLSPAVRERLVRELRRALATPLVAP